jgi:hypothetical protein
MTDTAQPETLGAWPRTEDDNWHCLKLRAPQYQGGYDGYAVNEWFVAIADRIDELINLARTEREMHNAWRKRAEEAESRPLVSAPATETATKALEALQAFHRGTTFYDGHPLLPVFAFLESAAAPTETTLLYEGWAGVAVKDEDGANFGLLAFPTEVIARKECRLHSDENVRVARIRVIELPSPPETPT